MTETSVHATQSSGEGAPANRTVRAVPGFFQPKPPGPRGDEEACGGSDAVPTLLFRNWQLATSSWAEFQGKFAQLDKVHDTNGAEKRVKVVYLVRHAEGLHNQTQAKYGMKRWETEFAHLEAEVDADLTSFGIKDAQTKGPLAVAAELARGMAPIERVVVSPMSRAIQTAQYFFAKDQVPDAPFLCLELCREMLGCNACDRRRSLAEIRPKFPDVDFSMVQDDKDLLWSPTRHETIEEIQARARAFLSELFRVVPEHHVVVATHAGFIESICAVVLGTVVKPANCEVTPLVLEAL